MEELITIQITPAQAKALESIRKHLDGVQYNDLADMQGLDAVIRAVEKATL